MVFLNLLDLFFAGFSSSSAARGIFVTAFSSCVGICTSLFLIFGEILISPFLFNGGRYFDLVPVFLVLERNIYDL